ncbi:DMT family transporter [Desulfotomaculum copahuensis]|uniref:EamA domain-containing protein n=1 Tax=Desulfotomaculum copahuensis TaxID=1838280 RepID=A0A1B7LFG6_9FIRM|nr:EamA family transporter [Desulfotomaculum copahuensis]OAT82332.1 hypothetical protein A6M21_09290 [Desulfotomaculum copahuensis]
MNKNILGAICLSLAAAIWGGMYVVSKYVLTFIPPFTLIWLRYVIALIILALIMAVNRTPLPRRRDLGLLAWIGFIGYFVSIGAQFVGTKLSNAHMGAIITSASPAFIVIFATWLLKEKLTARKAGAVLLATAGVVVVIGFGGAGSGRLSGNLALILAAVTWALLSVYAKLAGERYSSLTVTTCAIFFALLFNTPVAARELITAGIGHFPALPVWSGVLYMGVVSTALAFFLWNKGMYLMDAGTGSLFFFFQPLVGSFLGWLWLKEPLNWNFFAGGALILLAVALIYLPGGQAEENNSGAQTM